MQERSQSMTDGLTSFLRPRAPSHPSPRAPFTPSGGNGSGMLATPRTRTILMMLKSSSSRNGSTTSASLSSPPSTTSATSTSSSVLAHDKSLWISAGSSWEYFATAVAYMSSSSDEDEEDESYWDPSWVDDKNEAENRRRWEEEEKRREEEWSLRYEERKRKETIAFEMWSRRWDARKKRLTLRRTVALGKGVIEALGIGSSGSGHHDSPDAFKRHRSREEQRMRRESDKQARDKAHKEEEEETKEGKDGWDRTRVLKSNNQIPESAPGVGGSESADKKNVQPKPATDHNWEAEREAKKGTKQQQQQQQQQLLLLLGKENHSQSSSNEPAGELMYGAGCQHQLRTPRATTTDQASGSAALGKMPSPDGDDVVADDSDDDEAWAKEVEDAERRIKKSNRRDEKEGHQRRERFLSSRRSLTLSEKQNLFDEYFANEEQIWRSRGLRLLSSSSAKKDLLNIEERHLADPREIHSEGVSTKKTCPRQVRSPRLGTGIVDEANHTTVDDGDGGDAVGGRKEDGHEEQKKPKSKQKKKKKKKKMMMTKMEKGQEDSNNDNNDGDDDQDAVAKDAAVDSRVMMMTTADLGQKEKQEERKEHGEEARDGIRLSENQVLQLDIGLRRERTEGQQQQTRATVSPRDPRGQEEERTAGEDVEVGIPTSPREDGGGDDLSPEERRARKERSCDLRRQREMEVRARILRALDLNPEGNNSNRSSNDSKEKGKEKEKEEDDARHGESPEDGSEKGHRRRSVSVAESKGKAHTMPRTGGKKKRWSVGVGKKDGSPLASAKTDTGPSQGDKAHKADLDPPDADERKGRRASVKIMMNLFISKDAKERSWLSPRNPRSPRSANEKEKKEKEKKEEKEAKRVKKAEAKKAKKEAKKETKKETKKEAKRHQRQQEDEESEEKKPWYRNYNHRRSASMNVLMGMLSKDRRKAAKE